MTETTKPPIVVSNVDFRRLSAIAMGALDRFPDVAEELQAEMDRAEVVAENAVPANVVRMGSTVEFRSESGQARRVTLVFPGEQDISENRISVLTPVGAALIGLSVGQSIPWTTHDGREQQLTIVDVAAPVPA